MSIFDELNKLPYELLCLLAKKLRVWVHPCATKDRVIMAIMEKIS